MDSVKFIRCYKDAVKDFLPKLLREYSGLYGVSFELAGVEQDVYYDKDRFNCFAYVCTEDMYREKTDGTEGADKELHARLFREMDGGVHGGEYLGHLDDFL